MIRQIVKIYLCFLGDADGFFYFVIRIHKIICVFKMLRIFPGKVPAEPANLSQRFFGHIIIFKAGQFQRQQAAFKRCFCNHKGGTDNF